IFEASVSVSSLARVDSVTNASSTRPRRSGYSASTALNACSVTGICPSEKRYVRRIASSARAAHASNSVAAAAAIRHHDGKRIPRPASTRSVRNIDDLPVREPVRGTEPLAVAGKRLAGDLVRFDLGAALHDDLAHPVRLRHDHRELGLRVEQVT